MTLEDENRALRLQLEELKAQSQGLAVRLQELVTDSEARFAAIFRDAAVGILLIDTAGNVAMANAAAARILGRSQATLRGAPVPDLTSSPDRREFEELIRGARDRYRIERLFPRPDGTRAWIGVSVSLIRGSTSDPEYALALVEDVTERHEAEVGAQKLIGERLAREQAEAAQRRVAFLSEASVALSSSLDPAVTLERLARLAVPRLGDYSLVELAHDGSSRQVACACADPSRESELRATSSPDRPRNPVGPVAEVLRTGRPRLIASIDGSPLAPDSFAEAERLGSAMGPAAVLVTPIVSHRRIHGALIVGRLATSGGYPDSDRALAEELVGRAGLAIENALLYQEARDANRLKDDFLAVVSHELRTPLTPILGWVRLLSEGAVPAAQTQTGLQVIERNARTQARLIDDLLDVSRIIAGKLRIEPRPVSLAPILREAVDAVGAAARAKDIRIAVNIDDSAPKVMGDATRLLQVFWNLVTNAVKFTPPSGRIEVGLSRSRTGVDVRVTDTGEGIDAEFLPHVFERFRQGEAASTRRHGGLGLGLSIVRHLVELHGGTVSASSGGRGHGAVFTVRLPWVGDGSTPVAPLRRAPGKERTKSRRSMRRRLEGLRVVVVDDEPDTLSLLADLLDGRGAVTRRALSADAAWELLQDADCDLLVSDLSMPGTDGFALIHRVRTQGRQPNLPAIALSALARAEDRQRALAAGFHRHLAKPFSPPELLTAIIEVLPRRTRSRR